MKKEASVIKPYIRRFYRGNGVYFGLGILQIVLVTAYNLSLSWLLQQIFDLIAGESVAFSLPQLALFAAGIGALVALAALCDYFSLPRFVSKAMAQYKNYVFEQLSKKGISAFSGENTSLYISALSNDAAVIENDYVGGIFDLMRNLLLFFGALTMMLLYDPVLTAVAVALAALPIVTSLLLGNRMAEAEKQVSDRNEHYMSTLRDSLLGFSVVKSFRAEAQMCAMFAKEVKKVADAKEKSKKRMTVISMCSVLTGLAVQLGVFLVGAYLALTRGAVTVGTVLVFVQLLNYVLTPIAQVPTLLAERKAAKALIEKLARALQENVREEGSVQKCTLQDAIHVKNLSFGYTSEQTVLHDVSYRFEAGKCYAVVGASGSGKSTLLNLLMASRADHTGEIRYDDVPLESIGSESLYDMVSVVQQNVFVFNASIRDNITMFSDFPKEEVDRAIRLSGLDALIAQRGEAYLCGENGSGLSGGEKQRISIARSLLKNAQVLLVDEATAALDAKTANQVSTAILALEGVTRIVVTHSLEECLLRQYDAILALKNGSIAETGSFEELLEKKGYFYSLFTLSQ